MQVDRSTMVLLGGLGTLRFGASPEEVAAYLGEPGRKCWEPEKDRFGHGFLFANVAIGAIFAEFDGRLVLYSLCSGTEWMDFKKNLDLRFRGVRLLGTDIRKVCRHLAANGVEPICEDRVSWGYSILFTHGLEICVGQTDEDMIEWRAQPTRGTPNMANSGWACDYDLAWSLAHAIG